MLTGKEADHFIEYILEIKDPHRKLAEDPLGLLQEMVRTYHLKIPFQNMTLLTLPPDHQTVPSSDQMKSDMLAGLGGLCLTNNYFMMQVLRTLGYDAFSAAGTCNLKHPNNHIITIVCGLTSTDSQHLVDVGFGYPTMQVVPLDFELDSPVYHDGFLTYQFKKVGPQTYERLHLLNYPTDSTSYKKEYFQTGQSPWIRLYSFDLIPRELNFFYEPMKEVYTDRFLKKFRLIMFLGDGMLAYREEGRNITKILLAKDGAFMLNLYETSDDVLEDLKINVPDADLSLVKKALENWKQNKMITT